MPLIDPSVGVFLAVSIHAWLMVKTDFFDGRRDPLGPIRRRGPHRKPKPQTS